MGRVQLSGAAGWRRKRALVQKRERNKGGTGKPKTKIYNPAEHDNVYLNEIGKAKATSKPTKLGKKCMARTPREITWSRPKEEKKE